MAKKLYKVWVEFEDLIMADSEDEAMELMLEKEHPCEMEGLGKEHLKCVEFSKLIRSRKNREDEASSEPSTEAIDQQPIVKLKN